MTSELVERLTALGNSTLDVVNLQVAINNGLQSLEYRKVIFWLSEEIRILASLDEKINDLEDVRTFQMELSGFLKELRCPYNEMTTGHVTDRLQSMDSRIKLIDFLISELMSYKMFNESKNRIATNVIKLEESSVASDLKDLLITLNLGKPPEKISSTIFFDKIKKKLTEIISKSGEKRCGKSLFHPKNNLTDEQWKSLKILKNELNLEYDLRRKMLLTRLDVTIQSFHWSDRIDGKEDKSYNIYLKKRQELELLQNGGTTTDTASLLAARSTMAIIEKTSSANVRKNTKSKIQRHIMGNVPDRGGRASEMTAPAPEMPSWQKRTDGGGGGGGGRGGRGDGRGGGRGRGHSGGDRGGQNSGRGFHGGGRGNFMCDRGGGSGRGNFGGDQGGGRVQGGWSQRGNSNSSNDSMHGGDNNQGNGNNYRGNSGRSNYNRGGGGGGGNNY